jgi:regulator of protease activity HflC (stomatin/prohibitin superfamily)
MDTPIALLIAAVAVLVLLSLRRVPEGHAFTVYRFGHYRRTLDAGLHWILPLVEKVAHRVSLGGHALSVAPQELMSGGSVTSIHGRVYYQVLDVERADPEVDHLDDVVLDALRAALHRDAPGLATVSPGEMNAMLKADLNGELRSHGIVVTRCQLERQAANESQRKSLARSAA